MYLGFGEDEGRGGGGGGIRKDPSVYLGFEAGEGSRVNNDETML